VAKPVVGEVVVLHFPQTYLQPGKRRPALVVADITGDDLVLCQITSQTRADSYSVTLTAADFEHGGLAVDSFARTNRLFTVEKSVILYTAGKANTPKMAEIKARIRQLFVWRAGLCVENVVVATICSSRHSCCAWSLEYPDLDQDSRERIWRTMLDAAGVRLPPEVFGELAKPELNGRQIRNLVRLARILHPGGVVTLEDMLAIIEFGCR
jgi:mRNA interferase MazF